MYSQSGDAYFPAHENPHDDCEVHSRRMRKPQTLNEMGAKPRRWFSSGDYFSAFSANSAFQWRVMTKLEMQRSQRTPKVFLCELSSPFVCGLAPCNSFQFDNTKPVQNTRNT